MSQNSKNKFGLLDYTLPFIIGGLSGMTATSIIQPIDTFKVQIQVISEKMGRANISFSKILTEILNNQGFRVFYRGLDSAILRQLFYSSARLGSYNLAVDVLSKDHAQVSKLQKVGLSILSGAIGALIGNPFDVALIRRQASISDGVNIYRNNFHAFSTIFKEEGLAGLWTGLNITILRVVIINFGQLAARDIIAFYLNQVFQLSKRNQDNFSALLASLLTSLISLPADNLKVKLQKQIKGQQKYNGILDCLMKTVKHQGVKRLWVGFPIYLLRGAPHSFILIKTQMYLNDLLKDKKTV